jgi:type IV pilus assembly protein PilV
MTTSYLSGTRLARQHSRLELSHGFTLLETLIAMLVLNIGLLGAVRLGLATIRVHREAIYQSRAVNLANSMAERVRSNRQGRDSYAGSGSDHGCYAGTHQGRMCSPAEMAAQDLFEWHVAIADSLPGGTGAITGSVDEALSRYQITIEWQIGQSTRQRSLEFLL